MRALAERVAMAGAWSMEWCLGAAEAVGAEGGEAALRGWLEKWAPKKTEETFT